MARMSKAEKFLRSEGFKGDILKAQLLRIKRYKSANVSKRK